MTDTKTPKRYALITLVATNEWEKAEYAKKATAIKNGDESGKDYYVLSPSGDVVHGVQHEANKHLYAEPEEPVEAPVEEPTAPDQGQADRSGPSARKTKAVDPEVVANEVASRDFPGNYSIAMIPFVETLAEAFGGVAVREERFPGKLTQRAHLGGTEKNVQAFVKLLDRLTADVHESMTTWQKETRDKRREMTDMQRFLAHREFIAAYATKAAKQIKRGDLS